MDDFDEYAAARWPTLVRAALLLGAPEAVAVEVATDALARLQRQWRRLRSDGDPDGELADLVGAAWDALRRSPWWVEHPASPTPEGYRHLDALAPPARAAEVRLLLDDTRAPVGGPDPRSLPVTDPAPVRRALVAARRHGRRRTVGRAVRPVIVAGMLVALVVGALAVRSARTVEADPTRLPRPLSRVAVTTGPDAWVTWHAEGELHLGPTVVAVGDVRAVVDAPGGAVYVDRAGRVLRVDARGDRLLLGHTDDPVSLVTSPDGGLAGWVDTTDPARPALTVADAVDGTRRRRYELTSRDDVRVVGLRDDRLYAVRDGRSVSWRFATGAVELGEPDLRQVVDQLAVFGPTDPGSAVLRVTFLDPRDVAPPPATWVQVGGDVAELAPDGSAVITRTGDGEVTLTGLSPRTLLPSGLAPRELALDAVVGPDLQVAYAVRLVPTQPQASTSLRGPALGPARLLTCTVSLARRATECRTVAELGSPDADVVLAR